MDTKADIDLLTFTRSISFKKLRNFFYILQFTTKMTNERVGDTIFKEKMLFRTNKYAFQIYLMIFMGNILSLFKKLSF